MSVANAQSFLQKVIDDTGFRQQILSLKDPSAVLKAAESAGLNFTEQEMKQVVLGSSQTPSASAVTSGDAASWVGAGAGATSAAVGAGAAAAACV